ncbi:MAG: hypothetical protein KA105_02595 [Caulobacter sp.]|nr:hypothetical protein [Caulobacter sp.]
MTFELDTSGSVSYRVHGLMQTKIWSDLTPFAQGYVEAMFADEATQDALMDENGRVRFGFRHLAGDTLKRIVEDCEALRGVGRNSRVNGYACFQRRQEQAPCGPFEEVWTGFPPVTVFLSDEGLIFLKEVG